MKKYKTLAILLVILIGLSSCGEPKEEQTGKSIETTVEESNQAATQITEFSTEPGSQAETTTVPTSQVESSTPSGVAPLVDGRHFQHYLIPRMGDRKSHGDCMGGAWIEYHCTTLTSHFDVGVNVLGTPRYLALTQQQGKRRCSCT